ncbi:Uncharacterized protein OBRU01_04331 [Operophtera brumata]|uniref:Uncharacterized protein n=1 Tax=Operophtera brumata TaxID=104452 RepID=A0A0L7LQ22_OPEBR|nr:Uncharacterized protein OBRU01_04331 [Operophtera brumata]
MSAPNGMLYGGDEIGALVFDPGHHSLRVGYAQEDTPKADIPAVIGVGPATHIPEAEEKVIRSPSEHHPALFTEAVWTSRPAREKLAELLFEKYNAPAFFLVKSAVLAAFANGKSTALVVDCGASQTSAVPVVDGSVDFVQSVAQISENTYDERVALSIPMTHYEFPGGYHQDFGPERFKLAECLFEHSLGAPQLGKDRGALSMPMAHYEFPGGYHQDFGPERFKLAECLFEHSLGAPQLGKERGALSMPMAHYEFPGGYHQDFGPESRSLSDFGYHPFTNRSPKG